MNYERLVKMLRINIKAMTLLAHEIMKKVRRIYVLRKFALPALFFLGTLFVLISTVSVSHVIANMPTVSDIQAVINFFVAAFAHTDVVVKCALVAGTVSLGITLRGLVETTRLLKWG